MMSLMTDILEEIMKGLFSFLVNVGRFLCIALMCNGFVFVQNSLIARARAASVTVISISADALGYVPEPSPESRLEYERFVTSYAIEKGLNPSLVRAKITVESNWNPSAVSSAGAIGLLQVMPVNAKRCGLTAKDLFNPKKNIQCGIDLFVEDLRATKNDLVLALYRYNAGPRGVVSPPAESRQHAVKVLAAMTTDTKA